MTDIPKPPYYTQSLLVRLVRQTTDIHDLWRLVRLYEDLHIAGDIIFSDAIKEEIMRQDRYQAFVSECKTIEALVDFCNTLQKLVARNLAVISVRLEAEIGVQQQIIIYKKQYPGRK